MSETDVKRPRDTSRDGSMRDKMPDIADFIDRMRAAFGKEAIDQVVADGLKGEFPANFTPFLAQENGHTIGHPFCRWPRTGPCEAPVHVLKKEKGK